MKNLIKFAMGAAIAGALVNMLIKQRARAMSDEDRAFDDSVGLGEEEPLEYVEAVTLSGDMIGDDAAQAGNTAQTGSTAQAAGTTQAQPGQSPAEPQREDWYGRQTGDSPVH